MSDERQPTMGELRRRVVTGARRYAGTIGAGPEGETCHTCRFLIYTHHTLAKHPKCRLTNYTHGDATTIKTSTPACDRFEPEELP